MGGPRALDCSLPTSPPRPGTDHFGVPPLALSRHATARARQSPVSRRDGFHAGSLGVAWAAATCGPAAGGGRVTRRAVALSAQPAGPSGPDRCPDLVTGMAGSAWGSLALADELRDRALDGGTRRRATSLIGRATVTPTDGRGRSPASRYPAHLCGVSHGAGGNRLGAARVVRSHRRERFRAARWVRSRMSVHGLTRDGQVAGSAHRRPASGRACPDRFRYRRVRGATERPASH